MKRLVLFGILAVLLGGSVNVYCPRGSFAAKNIKSNSALCKDGNVSDDLKQAAGCDTSKTVKTPIKKVVNVLLYVVGVLAVIMAIYAGIKMTISAGNPAAVQKAKMVLVYSLVGLAIAVLAYAIVNFVIDRAGGTGENSSETTQETSGSTSAKGKNEKKNNEAQSDSLLITED